MNTDTPRYPVEIRPCRLGRGVFATEDLVPGQQIGRLSGSLMTFREAVDLGERTMYVIQLGQNLYVYPDLPFLLLNHACVPNAGIKENIFVVAINPIRAGEEITIDYSTTMWEQHSVMDCSCGLPQCRGKIGDFPDLPEAVRAAYLDLGIVQGFIAQCYVCKTNSPRQIAE